ncbi:hypothetical protein QR98_0056000 [Sarcoptes scabiei]|uniref:Uncharacterized protein n=1 Tax=Sarcoptes scabiei TaxID=52283 RepID=A0A132A934_SARSC|nr:hypothetical protein QR98_0056000 [Sarcoptes scabiei]
MILIDCDDDAGDHSLNVKMAMMGQISKILASVSDMVVSDGEIDVLIDDENAEDEDDDDEAFDCVGATDDVIVGDDFSEEIN